MDISVERRTGDVTVLALSGRLGMIAAIDLRDSISALVSSGEASVVLDMSGVDALDSSGLGGLISGQRIAREGGGDLSIAAPSEQVVAVLEASQLDRVLPYFRDADEALASWAA